VPVKSYEINVLSKLPISTDNPLINVTPPDILIQSRNVEISAKILDSKTAYLAVLAIGKNTNVSYNGLGS
jgi:hypothetical protein